MGIRDKFLGKQKPKYETLGNTDPVCPYCAKPLDKMPGRKKKCPFCAHYMYVRTRPADRKKVVVTEHDAAKIDEQWMVENGHAGGQSAGPFEGPPSQDAIDFAKKRGAQMAAKYELTPESAGRLAHIVSDGIKNKRGIGGLASDIKREFPDMSTERARLIAHDETAEALSYASLKEMKAMGITSKEWVTAGDDKVCDLCLANEAQGVIPIGRKFKSGHLAPPGHSSGCRCALAPVRLRQ